MPDVLPELSELVVTLLAQPAVTETIERLKREVRASEEPFVWSVLDLEPVKDDVPDPIRSGWIFVLQQDRWSGPHFHPNSVQHMAVIEGQGRSKIGGVTGELAQFDPAGDQERLWCVIGRGVTHEFCPSKTDMVVMSFHTCGGTALIEVSAATGAARHYQT